MQRILLIDRDPFYVSRLAERLAQLLDGPVLAKSASHPRLAAEIEGLAGSGIVIVASTELSTILRQGGLDFPTIVWLPWQESRTGPAQESDTLYRLMPASQMALVLKKQLAAAATYPEASLPQTAGQHPPFNLTVALDLGWEGHRAFVQNWLSQHVKAGREVFYLPLMPNYLMKLVQTPRSGPNLTHLLLRLANGDALSSGELGVYLELHASGYWQFRPAERSDDLMQADATWLRSLVVLVREKIRLLASDEAPDTDVRLPAVLVDCQGLSFNRVASLAVLADFLAVYLGPESDWASTCAQRELGELIARLPASCQVLEMKAAENLQDMRNRQPSANREETHS